MMLGVLGCTEEARRSKPVIRVPPSLLLWFLPWVPILTFLSEGLWIESCELKWTTSLRCSWWFFSIILYYFFLFGWLCFCFYYNKNTSQRRMYLSKLLYPLTCTAMFLLVFMFKATVRLTGLYFAYLVITYHHPTRMPLSIAITWVQGHPGNTTAH